MQLPVLTTAIQARYSDTDAMGHISNEVFVTYMALGRMAYFRELARQTGFDNPNVVANLNIDFHREIHYGEDIQVVTWCARVGNTSIKTGNEIYANGHLAATGEATSVMVSRETGRPESLPGDWQPSDYAPAGA